MLAVGHHLFYKSLDRKMVGTTAYDQWRTQEVLNAIGNGFAFLVRAALVITVSASYWQVFWSKIRQRLLPLSTLDSLAAFLENLLELLNFRMLRTSPRLGALALVAWLVPFAMVVPLASITAGSDWAIHERHVPVPDYAGLSGYMVTLGHTNASNWRSQFSATRSLLRTMLATAYSGQQPAVPKPFDFDFFAWRLGYMMKWNGPGVQCQQVDEVSLSKFDVDATSASLVGSDGQNNDLRYWSWVPLPEIEPLTHGTTSGEASTLPVLQTLSSLSDRPAGIYVAFKTEEKQQWKALNCTLYNVTYTTDFEFGSPSDQYQYALTLNITYLNPVVPPQTHANSSDPETRQKLSYLGFMDALGKLLCGTIVVRAQDQSLGINNTHVFDTELARTYELWHLYQQSDDLSLLESDPYGGLQWHRLSDAIEELSLNMSLAPFVYPELLRAQEYTTTIGASSNDPIYFYRWQNLVGAYGGAIAATLVAVILGCLEMRRTGVAYSDRFSTVVRTTRSEELNTLINQEQQGGEDPLPKELGQIQLRVGRQDCDACGLPNRNTTNTDQIDDIRTSWVPENCQDGARHEEIQGLPTLGQRSRRRTWPAS